MDNVETVIDAPYEDYLTAICKTKNRALKICELATLDENIQIVRVTRGASARKYVTEYNSDAFEDWLDEELGFFGLFNEGEHDTFEDDSDIKGVVVVSAANWEQDEDGGHQTRRSALHDFSSFVYSHK